jgi:hypothetical protein
MKPLKNIWSPTKFSYRGAHGTVHCVFFGCWIGSAWDYPAAAMANLSEWREGQPVFGAINESDGCEAQA